MLVRFITASPTPVTYTLEVAEAQGQYVQTARTGLRFHFKAVAYKVTEAVAVPIIQLVRLKHAVSKQPQGFNFQADDLPGEIPSAMRNYDTRVTEISEGFFKLEFDLIDDFDETTMPE